MVLVSSYNREVHEDRLLHETETIEEIFHNT
jgi:hypothetical protein